MFKENPPQEEDVSLTSSCPLAKQTFTQCLLSKRGGARPVKGSKREKKNLRLKVFIHKFPRKPIFDSFKIQQNYFDC